MQRQCIEIDSCIPTIIILVYSVVEFNVIIGFSIEQSKTGEVVIYSKDPSCAELTNSSSTGTCH